MPEGNEIQPEEAKSASEGGRSNEKRVTSEVEQRLSSEDTSEVGMSQKISLHKFKILSGVLGVFVLAGAIFGAYKLGQK